MGLLSRKKSNDDVLRCTREIVIQNRNGLHARPAAMFVKISSRYRAEVWVEKDGERVNGKSIMGLMMLAAGKGSKLHIIAEGADADKVVAELDNLVQTRFGEE
ncbi:MAG: phosphocarrier protein HPr [Verrucomicrobia bacterium 61-8]|nr:HPr family phosphocarrier protein [Verrucomicrobiota bacterium]OJV10141.1 MAG: phosphocarrier protein HPr [Verrucomicrobia bacterium 61-8]